MRFLAGERLWLLLALAALAAAYLVVQARRSRYAVRFTNLKLLERVAPTTPGWRRHLPASLFLVMLGLFTTAFAQPSAEVQVPRERATVMVSLDVSPSMMADDVDPDRLEAAKRSAQRFVRQLPDKYQVGLVSFDRAATTRMPPTTDHTAVLNAIERLQFGGGGTAIGDAISASLDAIESMDERAAEDPPPARIVLLSDGDNTAGQPPEEAAERAREANVPIYTIAFGTEGGSVFWNGREMPVPVDSDTLRGVAEQTAGDFYEAADRKELSQVYADIGSSVGYRTEWREISAWFVGFGLLAGALVAAASLAWFSRLP